VPSYNGIGRNTYRDSTHTAESAGLSRWPAAFARLPIFPKNLASGDLIPAVGFMAASLIA
jgi:hypothetical protein